MQAERFASRFLKISLSDSITHLINKISSHIRIDIMSPITLHESPDSGCVVHIQSVNCSVHKFLHSDRFSAV